MCNSQVQETGWYIQDCSRTVVQQVQVSIADTFLNQNTNKNRVDDDLTKREGSQKAIPRGSNTSCHQHARKHWAVYKRKCEEAEVPVHHWAVPRTIWNKMEGKKHNKDR